MHYTWIECIRSCTEYPIHGFLASRWFVYNQFVDLGNLLEVIVHHLLIKSMTGLCHQDRSYGECISVYGYTLYKTYSEL